jgi:hypothetical protein
MCRKREAQACEKCLCSILLSSSDAWASLSELYRPSPARLRSFRVISGHFGPALPRLIPDVPLVTVTLVREPVSMVVSLYGQLRAHIPQGHRPSDLARLLSFDQRCRREDTFTYWSNPQARLLAPERNAPSWSEVHEAAEGEPASAPEAELHSRSMQLMNTIISWVLY